MDYRTYCPQCGQKHIYFSHEIGTTGECSHCRAKFPLEAQNDLAALRIGGKLLLALVLAIFFVVVTYVGLKVRLGDNLYTPPSGASQRR